MPKTIGMSWASPNLENAMDANYDHALVNWLQQRASALILQAAAAETAKIKVQCLTQAIAYLDDAQDILSAVETRD